MRGGVEISRKGLVGGGDDGKQRKFVAPHRKAVLGQKLKSYRAVEKGEIQLIVPDATARSGDRVAETVLDGGVIGAHALLPPAPDRESDAFVVLPGATLWCLRRNYRAQDVVAPQSS